VEFVRQIIDSRLLDKISLPPSLKNRKVEIIILPINDKDDSFEQKNSIDDFESNLAKYKNPNLRALEKKSELKL